MKTVGLTFPATPKEPKAPKNTKEPKEPKAPKNTKEPKEPKAPKDDNSKD